MVLFNLSRRAQAWPTRLFSVPTLETAKGRGAYYFQMGRQIFLLLVSQHTGLPREGTPKNPTESHPPRGWGSLGQQR